LEGRHGGGGCAVGEAACEGEEGGIGAGGVGREGEEGAWRMGQLIRGKNGNEKRGGGAGSGLRGRAEPRAGEATRAQVFTYEVLFSFLFFLEVEIEIKGPACWLNINRCWAFTT
jgi:hypothetical protein